MQDQERPQHTEAGGAGAATEPLSASDFDIDSLLESAFESVREQHAGDIADPDDAGDDLDGPDDEHSDAANDGDPDGDTDDEESPDEGDAPAAEKKRRTVTEDDIVRFSQLVAANPNAISQVPGSARGQVMRNIITAAYQRGVIEANATFAEQSSIEENLRAFVAEREQLRQESPEAFVDWAESNPAEAERFYGARRMFAERKAQPSANAQPPARDIQAEATTEIGRLSALPENIREEVATRIRAGEFPLSEAGFNALRSTIDAAFTKALSSSAPVRRKVEQRQQGAERRAAAARPVGMAGGSGGSGENKIRDINDLDDLLDMAASGSGRGR